MTLLAAVALVVAGLLVLTLGGELLIRGAVAIAKLAGLAPAVIGLTIVAMGTSLPELVVSLLAALRGEPDLALGNVLGSNIFNIGAIVGIAALIRPLPVHATAIRLEWPFMFLSACVAVLLMQDGVISRWEAGAFVVALVLFTAYMVRSAGNDLPANDTDDLELELIGRTVRTHRGRAIVAGLFVIAGCVLLVAGARMLVEGAVGLARLAGLTERVIGLTVVAAGTSAPELAASVVAAYRGRSDMAVANIIGSNIFNVLAILGVSGLVHPIAVSSAVARSDVWWMLAFSFALLPLMWPGRRIGRKDGIALLIGFGLYWAMLLR